MHRGQVMEHSIIYVGLDVHKDTIAVALAEAGLPGEVRQHGKIPNTASALKALSVRLAGKGKELRFLSMAARNSPESSGRNSPLHSDSVTAKPSRRSHVSEAFEVEIDDLLKRLGGGAVAQAFGQGIGPSGILRL